LLALFTASLVLSEDHPIYATALFTQCAFYVLGGYGAWLEWRDTQRLRGSASSHAVARERIVGVGA
jgi:hypothetical protein